jgi:enamine deaminase RidA (YjgF/YER057c/UK114 family)
MGELDYLVPEGVPEPRAAYSHAVRVRSGELLVLAGQVAVDFDGTTVGVDDVVAQFEQVMDNLGGVLRGAGASFADVVKYTMFVVGRGNVAAMREARSALWSELYPDGRYPANTLLVVDGLASPEYLVEIEAIAAV